MTPAGPLFAHDKAQISDAIGVSQRIQAAKAPPPPLGGPPQVRPYAAPSAYQMPAGAPNPGAPFGAPPMGPPGQPPQPMAGAFGGAQVGLQGQGGGININLGPSGAVQGAGANARAGKFDINAALNNAMQLQQMQARYSPNGPVSASASYDKDRGFGGDVRFQKGPVSAGVGYDKDRGPHADIGMATRFRDGGLAVWTRKEGKNPEGGLNAKGRASLKAQGHDIKPPVSAAQAKKSPKAAARRSSFCARMGGMPGPMTDDNGKPTRKALALRKWDC